MFMKFSGYFGYDTRNNLEHFGDDRFNPLDTGFFFLSPGSCLLATSHNTGWMDIHEIVRIWTQEAIGCTVSRLSRLFHAFQTRRGWGLRSRSASCYSNVINDDLKLISYPQYCHNSKTILQWLVLVVFVCLFRAKPMYLGNWKTWHIH